MLTTPFSGLRAKALNKLTKKWILILGVSEALLGVRSRRSLQNLGLTTPPTTGTSASLKYHTTGMNKIHDHRTQVYLRSRILQHQHLQLPQLYQTIYAVDNWFEVHRFITRYMARSITLSPPRTIAVYETNTSIALPGCVPYPSSIDINALLIYIRPASRTNLYLLRTGEEKRVSGLILQAVAI